MVIKRIEPLQAAKLAGTLYALLGLVIGALFALMGGMLGSLGSETVIPGAVFGIGAIIIFPIFNGICGFIFTLIGAALYNVVAKLVGGLQLEVE